MAEDFHARVHYPKTKDTQKQKQGRRSTDCLHRSSNLQLLDPQSHISIPTSSAWQTLKSCKSCSPLSHHFYTFTDLCTGHGLKKILTRVLFMSSVLWAYCIQDNRIRDTLVFMHDLSNVHWVGSTLVNHLKCGNSTDHTVQWYRW